MPKLRYLLALALLFTVSGVFVNMGQMYWPYGDLVSVDNYDNLVFTAPKEKAPGLPPDFSYRSGTPLTVNSVKQSTLSETQPRSIFDSLLAGEWSVPAFLFNLLFWFAFIVASSYILLRSKKLNPFLRTALLALILQLTLLIYSAQIASDYLKLAAPLTIWAKGEFFPLSLLLSYLLFLPTAALMIWAWKKFREQRPVRGSKKIYLLLGGGAVLGLLVYWLSSLFIPVEPVLGFDSWIYDNLTASRETLAADIAYVFYSFSHYLLFLLPAAVSLALWQGGNRRLAFLALPGITLSYFIIPWIKLFYMHPRPPDPVVFLNETAFPGGFATLTVVFPALALILCSTKGNWRYFMAAAILSFALCCSWVVVRVHWAGDFIGGYALGVTIFALLAAFLLWLPLKALDKKEE